MNEFNQFSLMNAFSQLVGGFPQDTPLVAVVSDKDNSQGVAVRIESGVHVATTLLCAAMIMNTAYTQTELSRDDIVIATISFFDALIQTMEDYPPDVTSV